MDWPEPFGLVMIEAMACGTPVIAFRRGSVPEVLEDGTSGFIVDTLEQAVAAVPRITHLDRAKVRASFERRFTAERMAEDYLKIYELAPGSEFHAGSSAARQGEVPARSARPAVELAPAAETSAVRL